MELLNMIVLLFVALCTVNADISMSKIENDAKVAVDTCAMRCFGGYPNSTYYTYDKITNQCICRNDANDVLFFEKMPVNHDWAPNAKLCTEMCYAVDSPVDVEYVSYVKAEERCYCHGVTGKSIFNVRKNDMTTMGYCYKKCSHLKPEPVKFDYNFARKSCSCVNDKKQILEFSYLKHPIFPHKFHRSILEESYIWVKEEIGAK